MVEAYNAGANKYERLGEWAERIGWERFFEKCELEFTHHLIDDFRDPAYFTWRQTSAVQVLNRCSKPMRGALHFSCAPRLL